MTSLGHLKRLSAVRSSAGVKFLTPCAFPGSHCPLHPALALAGNIRGLSSLVIGTPECAVYSRVVLPKAQGDLHWTYVLDAHEVVFGCRKGLMDTLQKMDQAGAKAVLLLGTCVPDLIGEDIEGLVREMQPRLSARLISVMTGHFKCNSYPSGSWKTLKAIGALMAPREVRPRVVNVMGRSPDETHIPMPPLLRALLERGFTLRCLAPGSALEDFLEAPDAAASLVLSPFTDPLAADMEQSFGTPAFRLYDIYDPAEIGALHAAVAQRLGIEWDNALDDERPALLSLQEQAAKRLGGLRYVCAHTGPLGALPMAAYLAALGMEPLLLHLEEFWPGDKRWTELLNARGYDPPVCHMVNSDSDAPLLEGLSPALCLGDLPGARVRIPSVPQLSDLYGLCGYERTRSLLERILRVLDGPAAPGERRAPYGTL
ncbi:Nitrogenase molybdenum-iron protein, alpha and beta chains [Sporobacter termitidis DSM 10068]|uniref:Nitrogenase molybdenum-iron protein, alpha and beta chains n=1 Tax=Sporobacter termitidis DSM 10068 TaxID=1123282 RepID=A0A1M5YRN9_9FIRM|nr:nitrogenase component 1 [Sporobacter termitidis]SHI14715.1 Nitrogenase molybdenum-iron protein, alpha and beta chains [Sporobacter termitidis DSM 10068]